jgi:cell division protein ZapE
MGRVKHCRNLFAATLSPYLLLDHYQDYIDSGELLIDSEQGRLIQALQVVFNQFITDTQYKQNDSFHFYKDKLFAVFGYDLNSNRRNTHPLKGLYIWGGVGRGKTYLMNMFYQQLPTQKKRRLHFHRFMQWIHEELEQQEGVTDPLHSIAKKMAEDVCILCLDEMHVIDITDAMLLNRLFTYLFEAGIVLVTTSNSEPDALYKDGLQRERFLPAIALLKQYTKVLEMDSGVDYRLRTLERRAVYFLLSDPLAEQQLADYYQQLSGITLHEERTNIIINKRSIQVKKWADSIVWFDFMALCNTPRSTDDYMQIGRIFQTVLISAIPIMDSTRDDVARRFVNMIDVFYDLQVNVIVSAEAEPEQLYQATQLAVEFKRTVSRLREMQSKDYLIRKHTL